MLPFVDLDIESLGHAVADASAMHHAIDSAGRAPHNSDHILAIGFAGHVAANTRDGAEFAGNAIE